MNKKKWLLLSAIGTALVLIPRSSSRQSTPTTPNLPKNPVRQGQDDQDQNDSNKFDE